MTSGHVKFNEFQLTAARRRLEMSAIRKAARGEVSTHSRPKAAGEMRKFRANNHGVSTHSRPKAAGLYPPRPRLHTEVSTHSRPKAAGLWPHVIL